MNTETETKWRRREEEHPEPKRSSGPAIEIYNPSAEILPVLEGPETITTSIPSTPYIPPYVPPSSGSLVYEETAAAAPPTLREGFKMIDTSSVTNLDNMRKNPFKWFTSVIMLPIQVFAKFRPTIITHNKYTARLLNTLAKKDIANGWLDAASTRTKNAKSKIGLKQPSEEDIAAASSAAGESVLDKLNAAAKCDENGESEEEIRNRELAIDMALVKDYMFKTILLLVSFLTVSSWAYLFLVVYSEAPQSLFSPTKLINDIITDSGGSPLDGIKEAVPSTPFAIVINAISYFLNMFKPFDMAIRGMATVGNIIKQTCSKDMNELYDKKIWYIIIFYLVFKATTFFIGNYERYMNDILKYKQNNVTGAFYGLFILYYIFDVFTYPFNLNNMVELTIGSVFMILFIILLILRNIFVLWCLYYNQFLVLFLLLVSFIGISIGALGFFPSFNISNVGERLNKLYEVIHKDVEEKLKLDMLDPEPTIFVKIYRIIRNILHFFYDNLFFFSAILWILHMYRVFDKEIKTDLLRMNVFTILAISVLGLIVIKMAWAFFGGKKSAV